MLLGLAAALPGAGAGEERQPATPRLRVVVIGAHPDDPESGCGGLIALLTKAGHEVTIACTTCFRGERKIGNEPEGVVRRREATLACRLLQAQPYFFDYAHEKLTADQSTLKTVAAWLASVRPDIVVTHWPLDTHENHHVTSSLVWQAYLRQDKWSLYFFEVETDRQTMHFRPDLYLNIESVYDLKKKALFCHQSQQPDEIWELHDAMHTRRGAECGIKHAEAYLRASPSKGGVALPVAFLRPAK
jgi:LmbE family N-acetylglucosaminyl deacetylase